VEIMLANLVARKRLWLFVTGASDEMREAARPALPAVKALSTPDIDEGCGTSLNLDLPITAFGMLRRCAGSTRSRSLLLQFRTIEATSGWPVQLHEPTFSS
jgi:hypothetical protein